MIDILRVAAVDPDCPNNYAIEMCSVRIPRKLGDVGGYCRCMQLK